MFKVGDRVVVKSIREEGTVVFVQKTTTSDEAVVALDNYPGAKITYDMESLELIQSIIVPVKHGWLSYKGYNR